MKIGKRLHQLRKEKNMTLDELSRKTGVALATLSRIENGKMTGTIASHQKICKILGVSITDLYKDIEEKTKIIDSVSKSAKIEHFIQSKGVKYEILVTKTQDKKIMPVLMLFTPEGSTQAEQNKRGVEKFVYMMTGTVEAIIGKEKLTLTEGDSLYFDASLSHTFKNASRQEARAMCIVSPPTL